MDKLIIESLIGDPDIGICNGQWDRNFLTHFNLALLGLDGSKDGPVHIALPGAFGHLVVISHFLHLESLLFLFMDF